MTFGRATGCLCAAEGIHPGGSRGRFVDDRLWLLTPFTGYAAISLIYLLGVLLAGMVLSRGPVLLVAALSAVSWNFLFIPPRFTLHIAKLEDALTFATYFIIALTVGSLTAQLKSA